MRTVGLLLVGLTASCGRLGFSEQAADDTAATIDCDEPQRFQLGAGGIAAMRAIPTATGFAVVSVDNAMKLAGHAYEWIDAALVMTAANVSIATDSTATIGAASRGNEVLVASYSGTATTLSPRTSQLASAGGPATYAVPAADSSLAAGDMGFAFLHATAGWEVVRVSSTGSALGAPVEVIAATESAGEPSLFAAGTGYAIAWSQASASPNGMRLALYDSELALIAGPITANTTTFDPAGPRAEWARTSNVYVMTWFEKNVSNGDDVWFQILDAGLAPVTPAMFLAANGVNPQVASDGTDFWVTWRDVADANEELRAARVTATGAITPLLVETSGGKPAHYSMLAREGQAVLAWAETGGNGPDLWFAAMCP